MSSFFTHRCYSDSLHNTWSPLRSASGSCGRADRHHGHRCRIPPLHSLHHPCKQLTATTWWRKQSKSHIKQSNKCTQLLWSKKLTFTHQGVYYLQGVWGQLLPRDTGGWRARTWADRVGAFARWRAGRVFDQVGVFRHNTWINVSKVSKQRDAHSQVAVD